MQKHTQAQPTQTPHIHAHEAHEAHTSQADTRRHEEAVSLARMYVLYLHDGLDTYLQDGLTT